ncbi:LuxR C-terminal-related transcriptional regulator [Algoriphagus hitonicola]|uniref:Two-component system, OmpR family, alkaline phosphatase synthesis response regulator PhoP n=1 Tax=Algoriphagus hitonicola TaxID=435880 RepID=A0A1I2THZ5_9BACT|nr:LuxR C-terminal-related transcriptional regulator [Algoriphagus hitonicola]SFG64498.1 two-component system, OmpR family, alkaline phosphatase synthesis response regulator PhoP [Algoriphagus hitonicola]
MIKILLVQLEDCDSSLFELLSENGFDVSQVFEVGDALKGINSKKFDLVFCDHDLGNHDGFYVFKSIQSFLKELFIPFFLIMDRNVLKEELMLVYELGIDNVIFKPFDKDSILNKIEQTLKKKTEVNLFRVKDFKSFFKYSLAPMIWVSDEKIQTINYAVGKILGDYSEQLVDKKVEQIFELKEEDTTRLSYFKFKHQVVNECFLNSIKLKEGISQTFDLYLYRGKFTGSTEYLIEVCYLPSELKNKIRKNKNSGNSDEASLKLTSREQEVFRLSADGLPLKLIAEKLNISRRTVERHRANIMQKTNSNSIIEAISKIRNYEYHNS